MGPIAQARDAFSEIYDKNVWGKGSGVGSETEHTREYVAALQEFIASKQIKSVVDFGCGDWQFSRHINWGDVRYQGFDVVPSVVAANTAQFSTPNISFHLIEDGAHLPAADLLVCKDVLQHLPVAQVRRYLSIFRRLYRHILITNDVWPDTNLNVDIEPGQCRPVRIDLAPFNEASSVLLTWEIAAYGMHVVKEVRYVEGKPDGSADIVIEDRNEAADVIGGHRRSFIQTIRDLIKDTPLAPVARRARAWFVRSSRP